MAEAARIFWVFLRLGCVAFGGPVAHLAFFRRWLVEERRWLTDEAYTQTLALCQMLPGPSSSQTGFAIGIHRGGLIGGAAAWLGFTLPAAVLMITLGMGLTGLEAWQGGGWIDGLKLGAVAVVANALIGMAHQLCPDIRRAAIAALSAVGALLIPGVYGQLAMIVAGGVLAGFFLSPPATPPTTLNVPISRRQGAGLLLIFGLGLAVFSLSALGQSPLWGVLYRSGSLVFGGGHVVLPLLESGLVAPGLIDSERFLAGYGAAQAIPGPVFSFSGFLGAQVMPQTPLMAGLLAVVLLFAPGLLLVAGLLPFWQTLGRYRAMRQALLGINAAVVGLIAAVLYDPILTRAVQGPGDAIIASVALLILARNRMPVYWMIAGCAIAGGLAHRIYPALGI
jgi:chromate transporter